MSLVKSLVSSFAACLILFSFSQAHAEIVELCGQNVEVNGVAPTKDIPSDIAKFSGVWLGNINVSVDNIPCVAFVVQSVTKYGRAIVTQAYSGVGMNEPKQSGVLTWIGQIEEGSLVLISPYVSYQLRIKFWSMDNNTVTGYVVDSEGKFPVTLKSIQKF